MTRYATEWDSGIMPWKQIYLHRNPGEPKSENIFQVVRMCQIGHNGKKYEYEWSTIKLDPPQFDESFGYRHQIKYLLTDNEGFVILTHMANCRNFFYLDIGNIDNNELKRWKTSPVLFPYEKADDYSKCVMTSINRDHNSIILMGFARNAGILYLLDDVFRMLCKWCFDLEGFIHIFCKTSEEYEDPSTHWKVDIHEMIPEYDQ